MSPLLNYTTSVPVARSVTEVTQRLVSAGAGQITTDYNRAGQAVGITFRTETPHGPRTFSIPVNADRVRAVLELEGVEGRYRTPEHSARVAWRIVKDWIEAQLAIIRSEMVTLDQVMLPYMQSTDGRTVYELYRENLPALEGDRRAIGR